MLPARDEQDRITHKGSNNGWCMVALKGGNMPGDDLDEDDGAKDADEGPKGGHQVARVDGLGLAIA